MLALKLLGGGGPAPLPPPPPLPTPMHFTRALSFMGLCHVLVVAPFVSYTLSDVDWLVALGLTAL